MTKIWKKIAKTSWVIIQTLFITEYGVMDWFQTGNWWFCSFFLPFLPWYASWLASSVHNLPAKNQTWTSVQLVLPMNSTFNEEKRRFQLSGQDFCENESRPRIEQVFFYISVVRSSISSTLQHDSHFFKTSNSAWTILHFSSQMYNWEDDNAHSPPNTYCIFTHSHFTKWIQMNYHLPMYFLCLIRK